MHSILVSLIIILIISRVSIYLSGKMRQPTIIGEMIGGVLIGPSVLGGIFPELFEHIFSPDVKYFLNALSQLGISIYMFFIGWHIKKDKPLNYKDYLNSLGLSIIGIFPTLLLFFLIFLYIISPTSNDYIYAFFMGTSISITAFPVLVKILEQSKTIHLKTSKTLILSASIDDLISWIMLPLFIIFSNYSLSNLKQFFYIILYFILMFFVIKPLLFKVVKGKLNQKKSIIPILFIIILGSSFLTDMIGLHCIFGGFIAGMIFPDVKKSQEDLRGKLDNILNVLLVPIFFVSAGISVNIKQFDNYYSIYSIIGLIVLAVLSKYFFCFLYARIIGFNFYEASAMGSLLNARGSMIIIFANIGLSNKYITESDYNLLFILSIISTLFATPLYTFFISRNTSIRMKKVS